MSSIGSLGGGSSGGITGQLDVNWIVEQIIYAKQQPIRDLEVYEHFYEAKREAFQELNTKVSAVESALYDIGTSGFSTKDGTLSTEDYLTASVSTTAESGASYSIKVGQLAQAESYTDDTGVSDPTLSTIFTDADEDFTITMRDGSAVETIDATGMSLNALRNEINSLGMGVSASVIQYGTADYRLLVTADETGSDEGFTLSGGAATGTLSMDQKLANLDAHVYVNNSTDYIARSSNTISDIIDGVTLNLKDADAGQPNTILTIGTDTSNLKENIQTFVDAYNETMDYLNAQFTFDEENERAGVLSGESGARKVKEDLLSIASSRVQGIADSEEFKTFASIGLEMNRSGQLEINDEDLDAAINSDLDGVKRIFTTTASTDNTNMIYAGKSDDTVAGSYEVVITAVAEQAVAEAGQDFTDLTAAETLTITYGGESYTVDLEIGDDSSDVVSAINAVMDDDDNNVPVYARMSGNRLQLVTDDYGSSQSVTVSSSAGAGSEAGFIAQVTGTGADVEGTIGDGPNNAAVGSGVKLTSTEGDAEGLILAVTATTTGSLGNINFTRGIGETMRERMYEHSFPYTGMIAQNIESYDDRLQGIADSIKDINLRLAAEEEILIMQFTKANEAMAQMSYLQSTLSNNMK